MCALLRRNASGQCVEHRELCVAKDDVCVKHNIAHLQTEIFAVSTRLFDYDHVAVLIIFCCLKECLVGLQVMGSVTIGNFSFILYSPQTSSRIFAAVETSISFEHPLTILS